MGIGWYAVNHNKRERLQPINGFKFREIVSNGDMGRVIIHLMMGRWQGNWVQMVSEYQEELYRRCRSYKDITEEAILSYNDEFIETLYRYRETEWLMTTWEKFVLDPWEDSYTKVIIAIDEGLSSYRRLDELLEKQETCEHDWGFWKDSQPWNPGTGAETRVCSKCEKREYRVIA